MTSIAQQIESALAGSPPMSARQLAQRLGVPIRETRHVVYWLTYKGRLRVTQRKPQSGRRGAPEARYALRVAVLQPRPARVSAAGGMVHSALQSRSALEVAWAGTGRRGSAPAWPVISHQGGA